MKKGICNKLLLALAIVSFAVCCFSIMAMGIHVDGAETVAIISFAICTGATVIDEHEKN